MKFMELGAQIFYKIESCATRAILNIIMFSEYEKDEKEAYESYEGRTTCHQKANIEV